MSIETDIYAKSVGQSSGAGLQYSPETEALLQAALAHGGAVSQVAAEIAHPNGSFISMAKDKLGDAFQSTMNTLAIPSEGIAALMSLGTSNPMSWSQTMEKHISPSDILFKGAKKPMNTPDQVAMFGARLVTDILFDPLTYVSFGTSSGILGISKLTEIPLKGATARRLGLDTVEVLDDTGKLVTEAVKHRAVTEEGLKQLQKIQSQVEDTIKRDTLESFYADTNIRGRLARVASDLSKKSEEDIKRFMSTPKDPNNVVKGAEYIIAEKTLALPKGLSDDALRFEQQKIVKEAMDEQSERLVRHTLDARRADIEDQAKRLMSSLIENSVERGGKMYDKLGREIQDQYGVRAVRDLAKEWIDKGGVKIFGHSIASAAAIKSIAALIPGASFIDRVTQPLRNLTESLFNPAMTADGRIPDTLLQIRQKAKNSQDAKQAELFSFLPKLYKNLGVTPAEDKMISIAIASDMPPTSGGDGRLETLWSMLHTGEGVNLGQQIADGKYSADVVKMWRAATALKDQLKKNLIMQHEAGIAVFPQKNYIPDIAAKPKQIQNPFSKFKTSRAVNAEKAELVKWRNVTRPEDVLFGDEKSLQLERLSKAEETARIEKEIQEAVLKNEAQKAKLTTEIERLWESINVKQQDAILRGSSAVIKGAADDKLNLTALQNVIRNAVPQVDRNRILKEYVGKYYEEGSKMATPNMLTIDDIARLKEDLAFGDEDLDSVASLFMKRVDEMGVTVTKAPAPGTGVKAPADEYARKLQQMQDIVMDIGIKAKQRYLKNALSATDSGKLRANIEFPTLSATKVGQSKISEYDLGPFDTQLVFSGVRSVPIEDVTKGHRIAQFFNEVGTVEKYKKIITSGGKIGPIVIDERGKINDGYHRLAAMQELGITDIPVVFKEESLDAAKRSWNKQFPGHEFPMKDYLSETESLKYTEYKNTAETEKGFTRVMQGLSDEWHKNPGAINRTLESILGKEFDLRTIMEDLSNTKSALENELKSPGLKRVADRWFYKDKAGEVYERVRATAKEINDNLFNSEEMFTESALQAVVQGSLNAIRASASRELLDDIAKRFGVPVSASPSNFVQLGISGLQKEAIDMQKFERLQSGALAMKNAAGEELRFHPAVAQAINDMLKVLSEDPGSKFLAESYDQLTNLWKGSVTSIWPAFHGRNAISNVWQHMMDIGYESLNPANHAVAIRLMQYSDEIEKLSMQMAEGNPEAFRKLMEVQKKVILTDKRGNAWTVGDLVSVAKRNVVAFHPNLVGQLDVTHSSQEMVSRLMDDTFPELNKYGTAVGKYGKRVNPLDQRFAPFAVGRTVGSAIEDQARLVDFLANLRKTGDVEHAAFQTKQFLFDYQNLTAFERNVVRRLVPFYTYSRKNLELQVKTLLTKPGRIELVRNTIQAIGDVWGNGNLSDEERDLLPAWMKDSLNLVIERDGKNLALLSTLGTPFEQPFQQLGNMMGSMNPIPKILLEQATGYSFFNGRPISEVTEATAYSSPLVPQAIRDFIGYTEYEYTTKDGKKFKKFISLRPDMMNIFNSLPFTTRTMPILKLMEKQNIEDQWKSMSLLFGVKPSTLNLEVEASKRDKELQLKVEKILKDAGLGYTFSRFQLNKDK